MYKHTTLLFLLWFLSGLTLDIKSPFHTIMKSNHMLVKKKKVRVLSGIYAWVKKTLSEFYNLMKKKVRKWENIHVECMEIRDKNVEVYVSGCT